MSKAKALLPGVAWIQPHTVRLSFVFLGIIMCMSLAFSTAIYMVTMTQFDKQLPTKDGYVDFDSQHTFTPGMQDYIAQHIELSKQEFLGKLVMLNIFVLCIGAIISYLFARRSLQPIEAVMEAQSRFVSDASHELRTPLTAIQISNEVALRKNKLTLKEAKQVLQNNLDDVGRLQRMTTMLLELANQDASLAIKPTNVHEIVSRSLTDSAPKASSKHITIDDQTKPLWISADVDAAAEALTIVIDNAIKYSPDKSTITLRTTQLRHSSVRISVIDAGVGIAETDVAHVFDRFFRSDSARSRQQHGGYGLGLSIAKNIMEAHGGSIHATSKPGKGSTFMLEFSSAKQPN